LAVIGITGQHALFEAARGGGSEGGDGVASRIRVDFTKGGKSAAPEKRSGKNAKGGVQLQPESVLCTLEVNEGVGEETGISRAKSFKLRCGVRGLLLDVNQRVVDMPQLLVTRYAPYQSLGFTRV
jgi:hypothetical protein